MKKRLISLLSVLSIIFAITPMAFAEPRPQSDQGIFARESTIAQSDATVGPQAMYSKQTDYTIARISNSCGYCDVEINVQSTVNIQNGQYVSIDSVRVFPNGDNQNFVSVEMTDNKLYISSDRQKITGYVQIHLTTQYKDYYGTVKGASTYTNVNCNWSVR